MKIWNQDEWAAAVTSATAEDKKKSPERKCFEKPQSNPQMNENPEESKKAREKAVYYLQFSGKTELELRRKLAEQEFSPASVESAIEFVKKYRYLDDDDYARRFVERNRNKKSRKQMSYELAQKGVSREILDMVFEDMDVDEEAQICVLLEKRNYSGEDASREERQKMTAYLTRKGFSYEAINSALIQYARKNRN